MTHDVHETVHAESCKYERCIQEYENVAFVLKSLVQQENLNKRYNCKKYMDLYDFVHSVYEKLDMIKIYYYHSDIYHIYIYFYLILKEFFFHYL